MYGTVFRMRPKASQEEAVESLFDEWPLWQRYRTSGVVGGCLYKCKNHEGELIGGAVFPNQRTYLAKAGSAEQEIWYNKLRALLVEDPEWGEGQPVVPKE